MSRLTVGAQAVTLLSGGRSRLPADHSTGLAPADRQPDAVVRHARARLRYRSDGPL